jgi:hypothetical protein
MLTFVVTLLAQLVAYGELIGGVLQRLKVQKDSVAKTAICPAPSEVEEVCRIDLLIKITVETPAIAKHARLLRILCLLPGGLTASSFEKITLFR